MHPPDLVTVLIIEFSAAVSFYPMMRWTGATRRYAFVTLLLIVTAMPVLLMLFGRDASPPMRWVAAVVALWMGAKLYDLHVGVAPEDRPSFGAFIAYLLNPLWLVRRLPATKPTEKSDARRLIVRLFIVGVVVVVANFVFRVRWQHWPFAIEHVVKATALPLTLAVIANAYAPLLRLCGGRGMDPMDNPIAARTPADFWRRWNRPTHQLFRVYVFDCAGGRRHAFRATMAAFAVSAVMHEYLFSVAVGRLQGYQTAFFLINGLAVAATSGVRLKAGWRALGWRIATIAFLLATSTLFFVSVNEVIPIYARR